MAKKKEVKVSMKMPRYDKKSIVSSKSFRHDKDLLNAVLENDRTYTLKEVKELLKNTKKKEVY